MGSHSNMPPFMVIKAGLSNRCEGIWVTVFGKAFCLENVSPVPRVVWHQDFPLILGEDMTAFFRQAHGHGGIVVSTRCASPHPYHLMTERNGEVDFLFKVPQSIRGFRQNYPEVFSFVPALVYIPAGQAASRLADPRHFAPCMMAADKLLDKTRLLDWLEIQSRLEERGTAGECEAASLAASCCGP